MPGQALAAWLVHQGVQSRGTGTAIVVAASVSSADSLQRHV
jgi:hypothetical protein